MINLISILDYLILDFRGGFKQCRYEKSNFCSTSHSPNAILMVTILDYSLYAEK